MGADQVLHGASRIPAAYDRFSIQKQRQAEAIQFEKLGQQWRTMSRGEGVKKAIFLASLVTAIGYYTFLAVLFFIR